MPAVLSKVLPEALGGGPGRALVPELVGVIKLQTAHFTLCAPQAYMRVIWQQWQTRCPTWFACDTPELRPGQLQGGCQAVQNLASSSSLQPPRICGHRHMVACQVLQAALSPTMFGP